MYVAIVLYRHGDFKPKGTTMKKMVSLMVFALGVMGAYAQWYPTPSYSDLYNQAYQMTQQFNQQMQYRM
jgi:hypothetical protein